MTFLGFTGSAFVLVIQNTGKKGEEKKERMTPLDVPHHAHHEGLVFWLTPTRCLQEAIPFPITLKQAKAAAVTLSQLPSSSSPSPTPCR